MLTPWLELPGAADRIALWSKASGLDLLRLGTTATAEEITDTSVTQPLVVAAALLAFAEIPRMHFPRIRSSPDTRSVNSPPLPSPESSP